MHAMVTRARCCTGYRNIATSGVSLDCVATCNTTGCEHGTCVGPDKCYCHHGYTGVSCDHATNDQVKNSQQETTTFPPSTTDPDIINNNSNNNMESSTINTIKTSVLVVNAEEILPAKDLQILEKTEAAHQIEPYLMLVVGSIFAILLCTSLILTAIYFRFLHF